jgi:membrane-associated protein
MDWFSFICEYANYSHWIFLGLLILAGLNVPISEDVILLTGGALAATCFPEQKWNLYAWIFVGCWISGWEAYWHGRLLGPKLYSIPWFNRIFTPEKISKLQEYYQKFGILTFIVGRFIPGGIRNALFITSGMGKMPFLTFMVRDFVACVISSLTLYSVGFLFVDNYYAIVQAFEKYSFIVLCCMLLTLLSFFGWFKWRNRLVKQAKN